MPAATEREPMASMGLEMNPPPLVMDLTAVAVASRAIWAPIRLLP